MDKTSTRKLTRTNRIRALIRIVGELNYIIEKTPDRSMLLPLIHARRVLVKVIGGTEKCNEEICSIGTGHSGRNG